MASGLGGILAVRLLGLALVVGAVLCAARAGRLLGGARGSVLAAATCAALVSDPLLGTREVDAETVGLPIVMLASVLALEAVRRPRGRQRAGLLVASGAAGAAALLVKQNLADGLVFAVAMTALAALTGKAPRREPLADVAWVVFGAVLPCAAVSVWAAATSGAPALWYSLYGFRIAASASLFTGSSVAQATRIHGLAMAALLSGLASLIAAAAWVAVSRGRHDATSVALLAMLATEILGVAGGGYYWTHYLIGLIPATCLLVGRACAHAVRARLLIGLVVSSLLLSVAQVAVAATRTATPAGGEVGTLTAWLTRSERPRDSAVVLYGEAALFDTTRLRPAYPFLWTLPQRVLDPHLNRLVRTLDRSDRPTYVVVRSSLDPWAQDPHGRVRRALERHYTLAAHVCTDSVYLRRGTTRATPPGTPCPTAAAS